MPPRSSSTADKKPGQSSRHGYRFQKASDVRQSLRNQNETTLVEALTALRNQLTIKYDEHIAADDERLLLVKSWLDIDQGAQDLFELWERTNTRQVAHLSLILSVLSSIVALLSTHYTYHAYATPVARSILSPQWSSKLNSYLSTTHNELLLVTLKLYLSLSLFAGGTERRAIMDAFPWELKSLPKLFHMRRRSKGEDSIDILARPDIRTLYVLFLLSFVDATTNSAVKTAFLDQRRDSLLGIFKGLPQDSHTVVRRVLECCWTGIWCDPKIKRTAKISLFNEHTVQQVLRLYERSVPEGDTQESVPADVAHHFLLAICTRPGTGICFKDRGWYPREDEDQPAVEREDEGGRRQGVRVYNKILAGVLKGLKVNEDARQQELALRILEACPELVAGYWHAAALTLEPRLSSKWIANIAFFGLVISLPVPRSSFILSGSDLYRPTPPTLSTILENILPSVNIKIHLSRGLQSTSALVQHCTALALAKSLVKYGEVISCMSAAASALEEDEEEGQWTRRKREVEREVARRVPDFQVIVGFGQQKTSEMHTAMTAEVKDQGVLTKAALLAESSQRLLWLYHEHLPILVAETRFDVGKLLAGVQEGAGEGEVGPNPGLVALRQLHVLRLLKESEDFSWSGKSGSRGNLQILLRLYSNTNRRAMRSAVANLLRQTLSTTAAFQHDADEVDLWLNAITSTKRAAGAQAPDETPLSDEAEAVITVLDDCLQRCIKTPYRYFEELQALCNTSNEAQDPSILPSPMLVTLLEQIQAKVNGNLLPPSDVLAVLTFVRKLMLEMASKLPALQLLDTVANRVSSLSFDVEYLGTSVHSAVVRECQALATCRVQLATMPTHEETGENVAVSEFLQRVEEGAFESDDAKEKAAFEVIDALRFSGPYVNPDQFQALLYAFDGLSTSAIETFLEFISPSSGAVRGSIQTLAQWPGSQLNFATVLLHCSAILGEEPAARDVLLRHLPTSSAVRIKRALHLVDHRLASAHPSDSVCAELISIMAAIVRKIKSQSPSLVQDVKQFLFKLGGVQRRCRAPLPSAARTALKELLTEVVDINNASDRELVAAFTEFWAHGLAENVLVLDDDHLHTALTWLEVMDVPQILALLDQLTSERSQNSKLQTVLESMMSALARSGRRGDISGIVSRLSTLLSVRNLIPDSVAWEQVIDIAVDGCLPSYYDGKPLPDEVAQSTIGDVVSQSWARWCALAPNKIPIELGIFLERATWTDLTASIVARLIYSQSSQRSTATEWFRKGQWKDHSTRHVVVVLQALYDTCLPASPFGQEDEDMLVLVCEKMLVEVSSQSDEDLSKSIVFCVKAIADSHPDARSKISSFLKAQLKSKTFDSTLCALAMHLDAKGSLGTSVANAGLKWVVDVLSNKSVSADDRENLAILRRAVEQSQPKAHYAESIVSVAIQNHLADKDVLRFVQAVVDRVQFKPVTVNRYIQNIVQHPKFQPLVNAATEEYVEIRATIVGLLHKLFHLYPTNTCQPSHVEPLQAIYGGTLSVSDRQLLSIFQLFETARKASVSSLMSHWSPASDASCTTALEAIQALDPVRVMKTCISFPQRYSGTLDESDAVPDERVYDPVFVMLLFSRMLTESPPSTALAWVQLFRTNVVSLLIRVLSSHKGEVRALAMSQLAGLYAALQDADMQEKAHVLHILDLLKNTYPRNSPEEHPPRLPVFSTLHLAHALRAVFYPATFTYPLTARFLLQRYEFDTSDVPLLYSTLYSADDQWKKERTWIIRFLVDGMVGRQEWRVLKRRHTWDLVASIFQSEQQDQNLRRGALEFLANLTCNKAAVTSLVLGSALLSWIELQLHTVKAGEAVAWVKVIENVIAVVDLSRLDTATAGEWRSITSRCLLRLLRETVCDQDVLVHVVRVILRLSALPTPPQELGDLIASATKRLSVLETDAKLQQQDNVQAFIPSATLHTSGTLWQGCTASPLSLWGFCVESLWRASMAVDEKVSAWDALTSRLLLWRAIAGDTATPTGEWARREVVRCISS